MATKDELLGQMSRSLNTNVDPGKGPVVQLGAMYDKKFPIISNPTIEHEIRFGTFFGKRFVSGQSSKDFYRILDHFLLNNNYQYIRQPESLATEKQLGRTMPSKPDIIIDNIHKGVNSDIVHRESYVDPMGPHFFLNKRKIENIDFNNFFFRYSVASETEQKMIPDGYRLVKESPEYENVLQVLTSGLAKQMKEYLSGKELVNDRIKVLDFKTEMIDFAKTVDFKEHRYYSKLSTAVKDRLNDFLYTRNAYDYLYQQERRPWYVPVDELPEAIKFLYNVKQNNMKKHPDQDIQDYLSGKKLLLDEPADVLHFLDILKEYDEDVQDYNIHPIPSDYPQIAQRVKHRWSFMAKSGPLLPFRIDLTHVTGWTQEFKGYEKIPSTEVKGQFVEKAIYEQKPTNTFEVELEFVKPIKDTNIVWSAVQYMLRVLQNTPFPVTSATIGSVIQGFNYNFEQDIATSEEIIRQKNPRYSFNKRWRLYERVINKPVNIKLQHLDMPKNLAITDKADGERKLMYIRMDGAYLIYPPGDVMKYLRVPQRGENIPPQYNDYKITVEHARALNGSVLDGELVVKNNGDREYLPFDILVDRGFDIRLKTFRERYSILQNLLADNPINVNLKTFYMPGQDNFYDRVDKVFQDISAKPYGNDGLILNDANDPYIEGGMYKWKPLELMTIDFKIKQIQDNVYELYVKSGNQLELFQGSKRYPMDGKLVDPKPVPGVNIADAQIVEMTWDAKGEKFIPFRIRHDRDQPNNRETAINVWTDIMEPITKDTIRGRDLLAMRRYQSVVKKNMIRGCASAKIIDIGAGRGGDLHKWKELKSADILAVEPNEEYLQEYRKRLIESGYTQQSEDIFVFGNVKINLLTAFGQDYDTILQHVDKAECITMFNVLTFFFEKEELLAKLVTTIDKTLKVGGSFIGMVMDSKIKERLVNMPELKATLRDIGDEYWDLDLRKKIKSAKKYKNNKWRITSDTKRVLDATVKDLQKPDPKEFSDHGWKITRKSFNDTPFGNEIKIHLGDDTIVTNQTEYLVDFDTLTKKLAERGIVLQETEFLRGDDLSPSQQKLNAYYRTFVFKRSTVPQITPPQVSSTRNVKYKSVHYNISKLKLEERVPVEIRGIDFVRIGSGGCLLDALLRGKLDIYKKFNAPNVKLSNSEINKRLQDSDKSLKKFIDILEKVYKRNKLSLKRFYPEWSDAKKVLEKCENWQWLELWTSLEDILKANIVVIGDDSPFVKPTIYRTGDDKPITLVLYKHAGHFDVLAQEEASGNLVTSFKREDIVIDQLR